MEYAIRYSIAEQYGRCRVCSEGRVDRRVGNGLLIIHLFTDILVQDDPQSRPKEDGIQPILDARICFISRNQIPHPRRKSHLWISEIVERKAQELNRILQV